MSYKYLNGLKPLYVVSFFLVLSIIACNKEYSEIGNQIKPQSENFQIGYNDTTSIKAFTVIDTAQSILNQSLSLLGSYNDPIFGNSTASFLTQVNLNKVNTVFPDSASPDSIVLRLYFSQSYYNLVSMEDLHSKTKGIITVDVYKLNADLETDSLDQQKYNPNDYYVESDLLAQENVTPDLNNYINITLPFEFAESLINADTLDMIDNNAFVEFFKGLYIKSEKINKEGIIYYIDVVSKSYLSLYYSYPSDTVSNIYDYKINSSCNHINVFEHDYNNSRISNINNTSTQDTVIYIQSMQGLRSRIKIPYFNSWADSAGIIINKAELSFYVQDGTFMDRYSQHSMLFLKGITDSLTNEALNEYITYTTSGYAYTGEQYSSSINGYKFNITSYIQEIVNGTSESEGFYLYAPESSINARRVVLRSGSNSKPIKLSITYSRI